MALNPYFSNGSSSEQNLIEDLIIESLKIYGKELYYIPRTLVSKDDILNEDRLSQFTNAYPIEMYFENIDSFGGQEAFMQKFGLMLEQSATLVVARKTWDSLVGIHNNTIIPNRPNEGDLIYFPMTKGLFEIKFVKHQDPFYQLGRLYVYKLQVELFQYSSERLDTGIEEIDSFEDNKTLNVDPDISNFGQIDSIEIINGGNGYTTASVSIDSLTGSGFVGSVLITNNIISQINVEVNGSGYKSGDSVIITGDGVNASAIANISTNVDSINNYGDNNTFKEESIDLVFTENNPFGDF